MNAATIAMVAAFGLSGCSTDDKPAAVSAEQAPASPNGLNPMPAADPLPSPDVLTGVLHRLADTSVPAEQKVGLVQFATVDDQPALQNFGEALAAGGFDPLNVDATNLAWAGDPGHVTASVTFTSADPAVKPFTYPMEFSPIRDTWQLARRSADQLLPLAAAAAPPPPSPPR
jgi:hypothetical protein